MWRRTGLASRALRTGALGPLILMLGSLPLSVAAQAGVPSGVPVAEIPRTASGLPDMNGIWQALGNHHWDIEPHQARSALQMQPGPVVPLPAPEVLALGAIGAVPSGWGIVDGGEIPYLPEALVEREENRANYLDRDPEIKCYMPGVPRGNYMPFPFQILQSDSHFFIAYEYAGAVRDIYLRDVGPPVLDSWMGQSVGRWEGDTFVVEVTGFTGQQWLDRAGNFHSEALTVTERWTLVTPFHIWYEATLEDPNTFSRPWTVSFPLYKQIDPNARLGQFKCAEFVEELLYGEFRRTPVGGGN